MTTEYIRVIAPATLEEGYSFDVLLDGQPLTVVVPAGGVAEGEEFEVPYPRDNDNDEHEHNHGDDDYPRNNNSRHATPRNSIRRNSDDALPLPPTMSGSSDQTDAQSTDQHDRHGAPFGKFRTSLCSCCDVLTQATFWMALFCFPVLLAQVLTRTRLQWNGQELPHPSGTDGDGDDDGLTIVDKQYRQQEIDQEHAMTFNKIVLAFVFTLALGHIPIVGSLLVMVFYLVTMVWIGGNLRRYVRRRYNIPKQCTLCPGDTTEDRCAMCFCGCCAIIQVARHTHNDKEYPGYCCTTTGLELGAPVLQPTYRCNTDVDDVENGATKEK